MLHKIEHLHPTLLHAHKIFINIYNPNQVRIDQQFAPKFVNVESS